jgi:hypothetical protein
LTVKNKKRSPNLLAINNCTPSETKLMRCEEMERLQKQIEFIVEVDKLGKAFSQMVQCVKTTQNILGI